MDRNYRAHAIPKSTPGEFRIIHEFDDVASHREDLYELRSSVRKLIGGYNTSNRINLRGSVHGYPMGNPSMIDLVTKFHDNDGFNPDLRVLCSFDLKNFYHSIQPHSVLSSPFWKTFAQCESAFVDIGNGVEVLAQGSPLSQDVSNLVLSETDIRCLASCKSINKNFGSDACMSDMFSNKTYSDDGERARYEFAKKRIERRKKNGICSIMYSKNQAAFNSVNSRCRILIASGESEPIKVRYMRYVDNIHVLVDFKEGFDKSMCIGFAKSILESIQSIFTRRGFGINRKKTNYFCSSANRRMPILGLNSTTRVKCKRYYIDKVRAGLHNWARTGHKKDDITPRLMSSAVYVLYSDHLSINRLAKPLAEIKQITEANASVFSSAEALVRFAKSNEDRHAE